MAAMGSLLDTASQSVRRSGGLALLVGSVLLLVSLLLPWASGGSYRNGFLVLPGVAAVWALVGCWGVGLALSLARVEDPPGLGALALVTAVALIADVLITLNGAASSVVAALGGGPSLALVGLVAMLVGIWQVERGARSGPEQRPPD